jgi:hypothetical protein
VSFGEAGVTVAIVLSVLGLLTNLLGLLWNSMRGSRQDIASELSDCQKKLETANRIISELRSDLEWRDEQIRDLRSRQRGRGGDSDG